MNSGLSLSNLLPCSLLLFLLGLCLFLTCERDSVLVNIVRVQNKMVPRQIRKSLKNGHLHLVYPLDCYL